MRAFDLYDDAVDYKTNEIAVMHDHCCTCVGCYDYYEHTRNHAKWDVVEFTIKDMLEPDTEEDKDEKYDEGEDEKDESLLGDLIFIVHFENEIESIYRTYKQLMSYIQKEKEKDKKISEEDQEYNDGYFRDTKSDKLHIAICKYDKITMTDKDDYYCTYINGVFFANVL